MFIVTSVVLNYEYIISLWTIISVNWISTKSFYYLTKNNLDSLFVKFKLKVK